MKKLFSIFFAIGLTLSACGTASTQPTPPIETGTPTITPTAIQILTATITPLPTISTFDASTIAADKAVCPKVNYAIPFENGFKKIDTCFKTAKQDGSYPVACLNKNLHNEVLNYLNSGGDIKKVTTILDAYDYSENYLYVYKDLTGDQIPEFLLRDTFRFSFSGGYFFYTCKEGYYIIISEADQEPGITIQSIQDKDLNGMPEIVFLMRNTPVIIEWNGNSFVKINQ